MRSTPALETAVAPPKLTRSQFIGTLAGLVLAMLLAALDQTVVGTAMPRIVAELGGFAQYTWTVTIYLIASTLTGPVVGRLSDTFGRKRFYLAGIGIFLVASWLCGAAWDMTSLIIFRGIQGLGAGVMQMVAFTVIADLFPPARRGQAQGIFASVFGISSILGPTVGGYITDHLSWRWVFYVNLPLGLLAFAVLLLAFPDIRVARPVGRQVDYAGALLFTAAVVPFMLAVSWGGTTYPWTSPQILGLFGLSLAFGAAFVWVEGRVPEPLVPLGFFRNRIALVGLVAAFFTSLAMFASILFIPLFIQGVIGASATTSGNILTPMMLSFIVGSTTAGQIIYRTGRYKAVAVGALAILTAGMVLLSTVDAGTSYLGILPYMLIVGVGLGATMPTFTIAIQNAVPYAQLGMATGLMSFFRSTGGAIGAAVMGSLVANRFSAAFSENLKAALGPDRLKAIPPQLLDALSNPSNLMARGMEGAGTAASPDQLLGRLGPETAALAQGILEALRLSLADAIRLAFRVDAVLVLAVLVIVALFLQEVPLRASHTEPAHGEPVPAADPVEP